jgi:hypothetical protein
VDSANIKNIFTIKVRSYFNNDQQISLWHTASSQTRDTSISYVNANWPGSAICKRSDLISYLDTNQEPGWKYNNKDRRKLFEEDTWVAVRSPADYIQVGYHTSHFVGKSHNDHWGFPSWGNTLRSVAYNQAVCVQTPYDESVATHVSKDVVVCVGIECQFSSL